MIVVLILTLILATFIAGYAKDTNRRVNEEEHRRSNYRVIQEYERISLHEPEKIIS
jgi:hypothetical protein